MSLILIQWEAVAWELQHQESVEDITESKENMNLLLVKPWTRDTGPEDKLKLY